ncbi:MAG: DUF4870 domain-containing protein [Peptococcaceae bacterium]
MRNSDDKILAALSHIVIFFDLVGLIIAIIIYVLKGKEAAFVNFSAKQAMGWQIFALIVEKAVLFLTLGSFVGGMRMGIHPFSGVFGIMSINGIIDLFFTVVAIIGAIKALSGDYYKYPLIGDFIAKI